jgi:hypothetical protein
LLTVPPLVGAGASPLEAVDDGVADVVGDVVADSMAGGLCVGGSGVGCVPPHAIHDVVVTTKDAATAPRLVRLDRSFIGTEYPDPRKTKPAPA